MMNTDNEAITNDANTPTGETDIGTDAAPIENGTAEAADSGEAENGNETEGITDYAALAAADMRELCAQFPELTGKKSITELDNPLRYAALRDLGLTPGEAYLATAKRSPRYDNRSHLQSAVPRGAASSEKELVGRELDECRELFFGLSDREIQKLYKKVTK